MTLTNTALKWFATTSLAISLVVAGLMGWTANLGGQVRHTEIRAGASATQGEGPREDKERGRGRDRKKDNNNDRSSAGSVIRAIIKPQFLESAPGREPHALDTATVARLLGVDPL